MPKLRQRKDGGYFIRSSGNSNSVNTFQTTDEGASIIKSSGRELGEFFPDQLFFLLYDLGHLSTKGKEDTKSEISDINNIEWATDELSVEERVEVALKIIDTHGVSQLLEGDAAKWILTLTGKPPVFLRPLIKEIAKKSGYSYETIEKYSEIINRREELLESALCAHLQMEGMRTTDFDSNYGKRSDREVLGADGDFVHLETTSEGTQRFGIAGVIPDTVPDELSSQLDHAWGVGVGAAGLAALTSNEVQRRYDVNNGIVLPQERLEDFPVELPPRSELTEQYEALRLLQKSIKRVLSSPDADVEFGNSSYCDLWYRQVHERLVGEFPGADSLGTQQHNRPDFTVQTYRDCYGDGDKVTDFACIKRAQPNESEQLRLFGFGIFNHSETVQVPISPESEVPLPVYPQSQKELDHASKLLDEFPLKPNVGMPSLTSGGESELG